LAKLNSGEITGQNTAKYLVTKVLLPWMRKGRS